MKAHDYIHLEETYGAHNYHPLEVVIERGQGVWVWDVNGKRYFDCLSAYSALNQGHCHPRIVKALVEQAHKVTLTSRAFFNDRLGHLYQQLHDLTGYDMTLPMNTGAEAVETAIKLVRKWAYTVKGIPKDQAEIIVMGNNFQGRTVTIVSFSTTPQYRDFFGPHTPGFVVVPYGDAAAVARAINPNTAAIMLEPIQGEGGVVVPPAGYLKALRDLATQNDILLVDDEIQTGLGRTGQLFACDHEDVRPDVMILGKALGGGVYPVSAVLADEPLMGVFHPGDHGSTFGGNPLAAAVAQAALEVIAEENLVSNAAAMGDYFMERLAEIPSPHIKEVRGKGLLIGVELDVRARPFCEALRDRGVLCKETRDNVIRFAPPLVVDKATLDWALEPITEVLRQPELAVA